MIDIFKGYDGVIWDYDGVIINSEKIREFGFVKCLENYPTEQVDLLLDYHRENGGLSRFVKFRYFFEVIRNEELTELNLQQLCQEFSSLMHKALASRDLLYKAALSHLQRNKQSNRLQFIASGSAQDELRILSQAQGIDEYFAGIFGSPQPKGDIVAMILRDQAHVKSWCLIGDSINDLDAAVSNHIDFIGVRNERLNFRGRPYINDWGE